MSEDEEQETLPEPKRSCLGKLASLFAFAGLIGLGVALYFIAQPQDLSDIEGRGAAAKGLRSRDLKEVLASADKGGYPLTLSEKEINLYLRDTLAMKQGGKLAEQITLEEVVVRLEKDRAEVVIVRSVAGYPFTVSAYIQITQTERPDGTIDTRISRNGGRYKENMKRPNKGGRFGQLVVPEGFLYLVLPSFNSLVGVYRDSESIEPSKEIDFIEQMARVRIEEGKLVLDPRANTMILPQGAQ